MANITFKDASAATQELKATGTGTGVDPFIPSHAVEDGGGSITIDNAALSVTGGGVEASALRVTLANDSTGLVSVDDNGGSITVDGTVTANLSAGTNNIGDVDVLTIPAPLSTTGGGTEATALRVTVANDSTGVLSVDDNAGSLTIDNAALSVTGGGVEASALRVTIANDSTGVLSVDDNGSSLTIDQSTASNLNAQVVGNVAADSGVSGNPVVVSGSRETMADSAPATRTDTDADVTRLATTDGALYVINTGPQTWSYHEDSSNALTDASVHAAPGANLSLYVTDIIVSTGAATAFNVFFEEGATKVMGPYYLEAVAGRGLAIQFQTPKKITANTALTVTTSAAIAHGIDVLGFIAPG